MTILLSTERSILGILRGPHATPLLKIQDKRQQKTVAGTYCISMDAAKEHSDRHDLQAAIVLKVITEESRNPGLRFGAQDLGFRIGSSKSPVGF